MDELSTRQMNQQITSTSVMLFNFMFSYLRRDFVNGLFRKKSGLKDRNEVINSLRNSNSPAIRRMKELKKFEEVWFSAFLDRKSIRTLYRDPLPAPESLKVDEGVLQLAGLTKAQLLFFLYASRCIFSYSLDAEIVRYGGHLMRCQTYLCQVMLEERDFQSLGIDIIHWILSKDKFTEENVACLNRGKLLMDDRHGLTPGEMAALARHETSLDALLDKYHMTRDDLTDSPLEDAHNSIDEASPVTADDAEAESSEASPEIAGDEMPADTDDGLTRKSPLAQALQTNLGSEDPITPQDDIDQEVLDFSKFKPGALIHEHDGWSVRIKDVRIPYDDPLYADEGKNLHERCFSGYVNIFRYCNSQYYNFYPIIEWIDGKPHHLGDYAKRKQRFPNFSNVVLHPDIIASGGLRPGSGELLNVYCETFSNATTSDKTRFCINPYDLSERVESPVIRSSDDGSHRVCYVLELDFEKNTEIRTDDFTWLKINGHSVLPEHLSGLVSTEVVIRQNRRYFGPYHMLTNSRRLLYVDLRRDELGSMGIVKEIQFKRGRSRDAAASLEYYSENDKKTEMLDVLYVTPEYCEFQLRDLTAVEDLLSELTAAKDGKYTPQELIRDLHAPGFSTPYHEFNLCRAQKVLHHLRGEMLKEQIALEAGSYMAALLPELIKTSPRRFKSIYDRLAADPQALSRMEQHRPLLEHLERVKGEIKKQQERRDKQELELANTESRLNGRRRELDGIEEEIRQRTGELEKQYGHKLESSRAELARLEHEIAEASAERNALKENFAFFDTQLKNTVAKVAELSFEPVITKKILDAAASAALSETDELVERRLSSLSKLKTARFESPTDLRNQLVKRLQNERHYSRNDCLNIFICLSQSFITILSGAPGIGKTSLCGILGRILGLDSIAQKTGSGLYAHPEYANRYLPVSVEKGWTSKRDLIGYYNPLTQKFESPDQHRYECFRDLDCEYSHRNSTLPYLVLLDEANLSPMEYYFADFMNICDERGPGSFITIGNGERLHIPDTLRFIATINSDHTTETLSSRMIDRAPVIELPEGDDWMEDRPEVADADFAPVSWLEFQQAFNPQKGRRDNANLRSLFGELDELGLKVSARAKRAIADYQLSASALMTGENGRGAENISLDYAVSQRILPHLSGSGDEYRKLLDALLSSLESRELLSSAGKLRAMLADGERNMGFYRFFR